jgi:hypothetical protein
MSIKEKIEAIIASHAEITKYGTISFDIRDLDKISEKISNLDISAKSSSSDYSDHWLSLYDDENLKFNKTMERLTKRITEALDWNYGAPIDTIILDLQRLKNEGFTDIDISYNYNSGYIEAEAYLTRIETDEEYENRLMINKAHNEFTRKRELAELRRLKDKYETSSDSLA